MEITDVAAHAVSASGGALTAGYMIRLLVRDWIERQAENGRKLEAALLELATVKEQLRGVDEIKRQNTEQARELAVLAERVGNVKIDCNNLGAMVRKCTGEKVA